MLFLEGQDLETWVVPDGFLHPGAAFSRFEGERANLDVHEKPRVEMRLKRENRNYLCIQPPEPPHSWFRVGRDSPGIPPGILGTFGGSHSTPQPGGRDELREGAGGRRPSAITVVTAPFLNYS